MKPSLVIALAAATFAASVSPPSAAQSLRCKGDVANLGDAQASVLVKCGEPVMKDSFCKPASQTSPPGTASAGITVNVLPCERVDEWTYKPGYGQFVTTLRFGDGTLKAIKYGDRIK